VELLACQDEFFQNNMLDVKENEFDVYQPCHFLASLSFDFPCMAHAFFSERQGVRCTFSDIYTKFDAVP
jgi:hypothetical protein